MGVRKGAWPGLPFPRVPGTGGALPRRRCRCTPRLQEGCRPGDLRVLRAPALPGGVEVGDDRQDPAMVILTFRKVELHEDASHVRSEERRVGKECGRGWER